MKRPRTKRIFSFMLVMVCILASLTSCQQTTADANSQETVSTGDSQAIAGTAGSQEGLQLRDDALETLMSVEKVDDNFYRMEYKVDYALEDLLAQGAADAQELGAFVSAQVLEGLPFHQQAPNLACSAFTAVTPDGDYIQGRNLDIADAQNTLVHTQPKDGYASLSMASGLLLGYTDQVPDNKVGQLLMLAAPYYPVDGINEKGVSVAILMLSESTPVRQDTGKVPITTTMAVRMILDKAATVNEAIELMGQYDMHSINNVNIHFQIADANGDSAIIEYVNSEMRVLYPEGNGQVITNFFLSPDAVDALRDGEDRQEILQAALDEGEGVVTAEKAMQMLDSVKAENIYDELTGINFNTSYSIVFNNTQRTMDICVNMNYDTVYSYAVGGGGG